MALILTGLFQNPLTSAITWFTLLLDSKRFYSRQTLLHPLGGCSVIYLVGEALLLALDSHYTEPVDILSVTRILRSVILLILFGTMVISQATPIECRRGDEEEMPLLQNHNDCTRGNDTHPYYGTIAQNQAPSEDVQSGPEHFRYRIAVCTSQEKNLFNIRGKLTGCKVSCGFLLAQQSTLPSLFRNLVVSCHRSHYARACSLAICKGHGYLDS